MPPSENAHIKEIRAYLASEYERGFWEGIESLGKPIPGWWYDLPPVRWTPYERGFYLGYEVASVERNYKETA